MSALLVSALSAAGMALACIALAALCFCGWELIHMATYRWRMKRRVEREQ